MNNNGAEKSMWGVLFDGQNQAIGWREINGCEGEGEDAMVIFEGFGPYPRRLVLECDSALGAQEAFMKIIENAEEETVHEDL